MAIAHAAEQPADNSNKRWSRLARRGVVIGERRVAVNDAAPPPGNPGRGDV